MARCSSARSRSSSMSRSRARARSVVAAVVTGGIVAERPDPTAFRRRQWPFGAVRAAREHFRPCPPKTCGSPLRCVIGRSRSFDVTDAACREHLDDEYRRFSLGGWWRGWRASGRRRSCAGTLRIWAAGAIYAVGQVNFLFDRTQTPHMTAKQLADALGVVQTTMANKAGIDQPDCWTSGSSSPTCRGWR